MQAEQVFEPSHEVYVSRLRVFLQEYFNGLETQPFLTQMLDNLALHISTPLDRDQPMRKVVTSTAKDGWDGIDKNLFPAWEERLAPTGWEVEVADDHMMEEWFVKMTSGGKGSEKWRKSGTVYLPRYSKLTSYGKQVLAALLKVTAEGHAGIWHS